MWKDDFIRYTMYRESCVDVENDIVKKSMVVESMDESVNIER